MATGNVALNAPASAPEKKDTGAQKRIVNDFSIQVATVNGSGSQSANNILLKTIFAMGIPVSGKNLFSLKHRGSADLVHHPRQQARVRRTQKRDRHPGCDERGDFA